MPAWIWIFIGNLTSSNEHINFPWFAADEDFRDRILHVTLKTTYLQVISHNFVCFVLLITLLTVKQNDT